MELLRGIGGLPIFRFLSRNNNTQHTTHNQTQPHNTTTTMTSIDPPCPLSPIQNLPLPNPSTFSHLYRPNASNKTVVLGIEGSANKVGVGVLAFDPQTETYQTLSNPRKTYVSPVGCGFLPKETSWHHQAHVVGLVRAALEEAYPDDEKPHRYVSQTTVVVIMDL